MAKLVEFDYVAHDGPTRIDGMSNLVIGEATFCIVGNGDGYEENSADFWDALEEFKEAVPCRLRAWDDGKKLWTVRVTHPVRETLFDLFTNAEGLFEDAERQLTFW